MPRFIARTHSSDGDYNADFDLAIIDLSEEDAAKLTGRLAAMDVLREQDKDLSKVCFVDYSATYFSESLVDSIPESCATALEADRIAPLPDDFAIPSEEPEANRHRTECNEVVIDESGNFCWRCYPKHCDIEIETEWLKREELERVINLG